MPMVKGAVGAVRVSEGSVKPPNCPPLPLSDVNVGLALSWLAACAARKLVEELGVEPVEVRMEAYVDLDKLLDGREEIEYLLLSAVYPASGRVPGEDEVLSAALKCPLIGLLREKIRCKVETVGAG